ncbi:MAG: SDR family NAD(P)-dependent oxidoreductase [Rhodospirillaceae bacterium]|jgi:3-oxoacyl-[acyl-carrier protein] reductase|nr:SDR family NAD(P)-dependent oxidoreductase [Rhodospirillaceae bacterium]MBT4041947.1 SDR family NAD(P)-dependent oxidoreductase [Rhodospirillaceae bacterium]MBT4690200.1 SDR family NAD(P)-dependent oxidoreductase [Rhodospirillaceae bacterium]MBT5080765.1 SDR family NAD(P)-dependent oxidoreductase [Rhodospirillaceae bacterium]MBT5525187.1 SDR family NAD(P)-dependent oxidoreductase [Rhodospirillaceae bacterium]
MNLQGKAGIVTGAGRGIGGEVAKLLAKEGASVIVNDPGVGRSGEAEELAEKPADTIVNAIKADGGTAVANYDSVAEYDSAGRMVGQCVDTFGKIDFLVNVAGMLRERMIWNMTEEDFDQVILVHLKGHWNMCHHAVKVMRGARYGRIVNFSSDAFKGSVGQCNYAAAKAGIIGLTRSIAQEAGRYGITANAMCPLAATRMTVNDAVKANWKRKLETGLLSQSQYEARLAMPGPEFIAPMVGYLCAEDSRDVNGQLFHAERSKIHTYYYGEEARAIYKNTEGGMFTVDELIDAVPGSLMQGIPNAAPAEEAKEAS